MNESITRKEFLRNSTKYATGAALGVTVLHSLSKAGTLAVWPWPYQTLDTEKVRILAHDSYWSGKGCSYGAFHGVIQALRDVIGEPYSSLPSELMIYGHGGTVGWGTLCGALNGAAGVISLVCQKTRSDVLVHELLGWYSQTQLPTDTSNQYASEGKFTVHNYDGSLVQNSCGSVLCHASVTEWCKASGIVASATERKERCARLTGDVAAYAAKILNDEFAGTFTGTYTPPESIAMCSSCHSSGSMNTVAAKMDCTPCHVTAHQASSVELLGGAAVSYELLQNFPNPFNPSTTIRFSLPSPETVRLSVFDIHGRLIRTLVEGQEFDKGTYQVPWDGRDNGNARVASGTYFSRMEAGEHRAVRKMILTK